MHHTSNQNAFFERLYQENYTLVYKHVTYCLRRCSFPLRDATDLTQEVFTHAAKQLDRLAEHCNPVGWLICATKLTCLNYVKKHARRKEQLFETLDLHADVRDEFALLDILISLEQTLSPQDYALVKAYCIDQRPAEEVCQENGISANLLRVRIHRIRKNLSQFFVFLVILTCIHHI